MDFVFGFAVLFPEHVEITPAVRIIRTENEMILGRQRQCTAEATAQMIFSTMARLDAIP